MRARLRAVPVFWQTLGLLLSALLIVQAVGFALLLVLPPPRPEFTRMSDIAATLQGLSGTDDREQPLQVGRVADPPIRPANLVEEPALTNQLAARLHRPPAQVRLFSEPDRGPGFPFVRRSHRPHPWRERLFFGQLTAAVAEPGGWRIATTAPPPWVQPWQRRMMLWFAVAASALVPLAWVSARAASRQIRRFAEAADRLGADARAAPMEERGSVELQVAARAFNRMQGRLRDYLDERTAMIGAIAHDLRTPLARIAFRVEGASEPIREKVLADVAQMQAMISATIGFVRNTGGHGRRVPLDLAELVRALAAQEQELGRPVALRAVEPAPIAGDAIALERLVQNLVSNGVSYGGGIELSVQRCGHSVRLLCADRGPGLPPDLIERVFHPFVRADPSRNRATGGIGLGLTIARTIAEDHGGTLTLANRPGGGLEAQLELPMVAATPLSPAPAKALVSG
jgi:signal transduction histidine kinase